MFNTIFLNMLKTGLTKSSCGEEIEAKKKSSTDPIFYPHIFYD